MQFRRLLGPDRNRWPLTLHGAAPLGTPGLGIPCIPPLEAIIPLMLPPVERSPPAAPPGPSELESLPLESLVLPELPPVLSVESSLPLELLPPLKGMLLRPTLGYGSPEPAPATLLLGPPAKLRTVNFNVMVIITNVIITVMIPAASPLNNPVPVILVGSEEEVPGVKSGGIVMGVLPLPRHVVLTVLRLVPNVCVDLLFGLTVCLLGLTIGT